MSAFTKKSGSSKFSVASKIVAIGASALLFASCSSSEGGSETTADPGKDLTLKIGTMLPQSGSLAFLGPPEEAGVALAAQDVNAAEGGVTIDDVVFGDSGDLDNKAYESEVPRVLGEDVSVLIGAASSGVSKMFIDDVTGAGVLQFSPANTSADFTTYEDDGLFWRTAPSDVLQGNVLGNLIASDGNKTLGMIVLNDSYGTGLASFTGEAFEAAGGEVVSEATFNAGDSSFDAQVSQVMGANPDAIAIIAFDETKTIVPALSDFPKDKLYFVDGNLADYSKDFKPDTLTGAKGTLPGLDTATLGDFTDRVNDLWVEQGNDELTDFSYAAESYDAVVLSALAAKAAGATDGKSIASKLQEVSGGSGEGEKCTEVAECFKLLDEGKTIDYDGLSGPITFDENGDPTEATIGIFQYGEDNTYSRIN